MAGTTQGGINAAQTNRKKHDKEYKKLYGMTFYQYIGSLGGKTPTLTPKGFAAMSPEKRSEAGRRGGQRSRR